MSKKKTYFYYVRCLKGTAKQRRFPNFDTAVAFAEQRYMRYRETEVIDVKHVANTQEYSTVHVVDDKGSRPISFVSERENWNDAVKRYGIRTS
jgi:hypothetical protein